LNPSGNLATALSRIMIIVPRGGIMRFVTAERVDLSVVIPAFNEATLIAGTLETVTAHLAHLPLAWEVIVVDDGSTDSTAAIVAGIAEAQKGVRLIRQRRNQGKGAGVRRGVMDARGDYIFFMDADLSVPIEEIDEALDAMMREDLPILIGSRRTRGARVELHQPRHREYMGVAFTWLTRLLLMSRIRDFTCGFKGFRRSEARHLFSLQCRDDWTFDAEILYLAQLLDLPVCQHPVRWRHGKDSKVRFPRDIARTLAGLVEIRLRAPAEARRSGLGVNEDYRKQASSRRS
jgi:dolichyl-phosphate beta-glucosyltransferase